MASLEIAARRWEYARRIRNVGRPRRPNEMALGRPMVVDRRFRKAARRYYSPRDEHAVDIVRAKSWISWFNPAGTLGRCNHRLMRKLLKKQGFAAGGDCNRRLRSYGTAIRFGGLPSRLSMSKACERTIGQKIHISLRCDGRPESERCSGSNRPRPRSGSSPSMRPSSTSGRATSQRHLVSRRALGRFVRRRVDETSGGTVRRVRQAGHAGNLAASAPTSWLHGELT